MYIYILRNVTQQYFSYYKQQAVVWRYRPGADSDTSFEMCTIGGGADKSLTRPGSKQATATKLGIIQHTPHEAQHTCLAHPRSQRERRTYSPVVKQLQRESVRLQQPKGDV